MNNYTLGRGKVYLARFANGAPTSAYRYIGNTPELSLTIDSDTLDHFNSDEGVREKDDSVALETNRSGSLTTDNVNADNVSIFFFGEKSLVTQTAVAAAPETFTGVIAGHSYKLGVSDLRPAGYFGIDPEGFAVSVGATQAVAGVDYEIDYDNGFIHLLSGSTLLIEGADMDVTYAVRSSTRERVISGSQPVECSMLYVTNNPKGEDVSFFFPWVKLTPSGDYALKGDDWQAIPLNLEILKPSGQEAIYRDNNPVYS